MIGKLITWFGRPAFVMCDAKCDKAWGINNRPKEQLSAAIDDYAYLADHELGVAPIDPGTYEGGCAKPTKPEERLNKWCVRECERSDLGGYREEGQIVQLADFSKRIYNMPSSEPKAG